LDVPKAETKDRSYSYVHPILRSSNQSICGS